MSRAMAVFLHEMANMEPQFARVLPAHLPAERLTRTIESAVIANPKLLECNRATLWQACMSAAVFGLEVDGRQSAVVQYGRNAQLIPMVAGLITLAYNAGWIIDADIVRASDDFHYTRGDGAMLHHIPSRSAVTDDSNPITAAYAIAWPRGFRSDRIFKVCELAEIVQARDRSSAYKAFKSGRLKSTPWATDFAAMARKTPIRRLCNQLPWQIQKATELEARHDDGEIVYATPADDGGVVIEGMAVEQMSPNAIDGK